MTRSLRYFLLFVLVSSGLATAQDCDKTNDPSLLKGSYAFRFDTFAPYQIQKAVSLRQTSILGGAAYDGKGNIVVVFNGFMTVQPGKVEQLFPGNSKTLKGTYCTYPNSFGTATVSDGNGETWSWTFIRVNHGQELETLHSGHGFNITFTQKSR